MAQTGKMKSEALRATTKYCMKACSVGPTAGTSLPRPAVTLVKHCVITLRLCTCKRLVASPLEGQRHSICQCVHKHGISHRPNSNI